MPLNQYTEITFAARSVRGEIVDRLRAMLADDLARLLVSLLDNSSTTLRADVATELVEKFLAGLRDYGDQFFSSVVQATGRAATLAAESHAVALAAVAPPLIQAGVSFNDIPFRALEGMVARRGLARQLGVDGFSGLFRTLIERNVTQLAGAVDEYLQFSVASGITNRQASYGLANILADGDPALEAALRVTGPKQLRRGVTLDKLSPTARRGLSRAQALLRRTQLIAIHEINSAYDEADKAAALRSPVVGALRWRVSGRHDGLKSSPDICDVAREADPYGLGPGVYPVGRAPTLQHPRCACWTEKILRPRNEWRNPKEPPPDLTPPSLDEVRSILDTDKGERTLRQFTESLERAAA